MKKMSHKTNQARNKKSKEKTGKGKGNAKETEKGKENETKEGKYFDEVIEVDDNTAKDFEFLAHAPVSENDHFVFKSEKNWSIDVSKYSEFFTLDLKTLSAAIESIPFNMNVNIDKKYFTVDQLTNIYNNAERGKKKYDQMLSSLETNSSVDKKEKEDKESVEDTEEDLDFLLLLKEPVNNPSLAVKSVPMSYSTDSNTTAGASKPNSSTKPLDLEKWLDSVLDD